MSKNQNTFDEHLLEIMTRFKNGKATPAEIQEIELWYENQSSNEGYTDHMSADERSETERKMLLRISDSIKSESTPAIKLYPNQWLKTFAIAAAMLLVIGALFYFKSGVQKTDQNNLVVAKANDVAPGSNKAILTLANGKKISLAGLTNGQIASQSGIRISKTANGQLVYEATATTASKGLKPEFNTIEVPVGGQWQVILPDHSKVWLNALSSITYPIHFIGNEREVKISGEAYFEVAHNAKMPFKVHAGSQVVEVLGTHFNVMAYAEDKVIKTTLLEGSVKISEGKEIGRAHV